MNYLKDQDLYGILFKDIVNQYIVVENNNLKEFVSKMGVEDTDKIPDKIESTKLTEYLNYEEIKPLISKYLNIAIEAIPEDNYSKIEKGDISLGDKTIQADGYQMKLKTKDIQSILTKVLESAKNDEQLFNLMKKLNSEDITFEDYQNNINDTLAELSEEISEEENVDYISINVYKQGKDTVKLSASRLVAENTGFEIDLDKTDKGLLLTYNKKTPRSFVDGSIDGGVKNVIYGEEEANITITKTANTEEQENFEIVISEQTDGEETGRFTIHMERTGSLALDNVEFNLTINNASDSTIINIGLQNIVNFSTNMEFDEFEEGNYAIINEFSEEQLSNLFTNLGSKLSEKLQDEMFMSTTREVGSSLENSIQDVDDSIQDAIEEESTLSDRTLTVDGVQYNSPEEYLNGI